MVAAGVVSFATNPHILESLGMAHYTQYKSISRLRHMAHSKSLMVLGVGAHGDFLA